LKILTLATVYSGVIKDVIENVKKDFDENGVDLGVLRELERLWEQKIRSAKVAPWEANGLSGEDHNQNNQNNINGGSSNPAHYMQQSMQSMQQPMQQTMQQPIQPPSDPNMKFHQSREQAAALPSLAVNMHTNHNNEAGRPQPYIVNGNGNPLPTQPSPASFPPSSDISNRSTPINSQTGDQKIYHHHQHQNQNLHTMMGQQQV